MSIHEIYNYVQFNEGVATSGQPLSNEFKDIAESGFHAVVNLAMHNSDDAVANEGSIVTALEMAYFHIPVPFEAPTAKHLKLFIHLMECLKSDKVWVHCAANYRVAAFMYQYQRHVYGVPADAAKSPIFEFWQPDKIWQDLMALSADDIGYINVNHP